MNTERTYRILEIKDWLRMEESARYKPYPKGRHPVAFKARMTALGLRKKDATEEDVQIKKHTMERELERLEAQEKADAERVRIAKDNAIDSTHCNSAVPLRKGGLSSVPEREAIRMAKRPGEK